MPNGGIKPSCWTCQWGTHSDSDPLALPIYCRLHKLVVEDSMDTFCADLSREDSPGLAGFIKAYQFEPGMMYFWVGNMYNPEPVMGPSIEEYAIWSPEMRLENLRMLSRQKEEGEDRDNPKNSE